METSNLVAHGVYEDGELWSFIRRCMSQGKDIHLDHAERTYEEFSARLDVAALERLPELQAYIVRAVIAQKQGVETTCSCAAILDAEAARQRKVWDDFRASGKEGPATSYHTFVERLADMIRKPVAAEKATAGETTEFPPDQLLDVHSICDQRDLYRSLVDRAIMLIDQAPIHSYGQRYDRWKQQREAIKHERLTGRPCEHPPAWRTGTQCGVCLAMVDESQVNGT